MKHKQTIAVYGGSFDPIHKGHTAIIKNLVNQFDRVVVVPAFMSPHKKQHDYALAAHRLKMIQLALEEENLLQNQYIDISAYELDRQAATYTIDTVQYLKNLYPAARLYFCIGSENLKTLHLWKDFDTLNKLVEFFVISRPSFFQVIPPNINAAIAPFSGLDTSSSLIKALIALNEYHLINKHSPLPDFDAHLHTSVLDYIRTQNIYPMHNKIGKLYHRFAFNKNRIPHILGTIKLAITLAKLYNIDSHKASLAALLHDIAKYTTPLQVKEQGLNIDINRINHVVYHARVGEVIARQLLKIDDSDILNAIKYHTTKRADMSILEKITALADYLEENRDFEEIAQMREMLFIDIDKAMKMVLEDMIRKLEAKNKDIYYSTKEAYDFYNKE